MWGAKTVLTWMNQRVLLNVRVWLICHEERLVMGETNSGLERIFNSYRYQVKNVLAIVSSIYIVESACWWKQHTSENFIPLVYSFELKKNTKRKILKLSFFYLVEKIVRFHVDCRPQFSIVYLRWLDPVFLGGYHPTLKLSGIPTFTFIVSITHRMDNI